MKAVLVVAVVVAVGLASLATPGASPASGSSCGTMTTTEHVEYRVTIKKGSPSCTTIRGVVKEYGHPKAVRYTCSPHAHLCMYGVYANGWRCTGLFQGTFGCWLGGNAKGDKARQSFYAATVY